MSDNMPYVLDPFTGQPVHPRDGISGVAYLCPYCDTARYGIVQPSDGDPYWRRMWSTLHSGVACSVLNDSTKMCTLVDVRAVVCNAMRVSREPVLPPKGRGPGKPRGPRERVVLCNSLEKIVQCKLLDLDDIDLGDGEMLTDHVVSLHNARAILNRIKPLGDRVVQAYLDNCYDGIQTIRTAAKAHKGENGRDTAAKMLLNLQCDDADLYKQVLKFLYIRYWNPQNSRWQYLPRYRTVLIAGRWTPIVTRNCNNPTLCSWNRNAQHTHCIGRQVTKLVSMDQIYVDPTDLINYPYLNGWADIDM